MLVNLMGYEMEKYCTDFGDKSVKTLVHVQTTPSISFHRRKTNVSTIEAC